MQRSELNTIRSAVGDLFLSDEWNEIGVDADDVHFLAGHGMTCGQVSGWMNSGSGYDPAAWLLFQRAHIGGHDDPDFGLLAYRLRGITDPERIAGYGQQRVPAKVAARYVRFGVTDPLAAHIYHSGAVPAPDAHRYQMAGFIPYDGLWLHDKNIRGYEAWSAVEAGCETAEEVVAFITTKRRVTNDLLGLAPKQPKISCDLQGEDHREQ